jgi:hypothetical protein
MEAELSQLRQSIADQEQRLLRANVTPFFSVVHESVFSPLQPMNGLIQYLASVSSGAAAVVSKQVIELRASSTIPYLEYEAAKLVDQKENTYFHSSGGAGQWISIDFKGMRVSPTYYTLLARNNYGPNDCNLKSWVLEGSETGKDSSWVEMDIGQDRAELNARGFRHTFPVKRRADCRFIRLRSIGPHFGDDALVLAGMELFGALMMKSG